jgi:acyl carrier protein
VNRATDGTAKRAEILAAVAEVAREHLGHSAPLEESQRLLEDLDLDSIRRLVLAAEVENRFRVTLAPADEARITTVGDLVGVLEEKLSE